MPSTIHLPCPSLERCVERDSEALSDLTGVCSDSDQLVMSASDRLVMAASDRLVMSA